MTDKEKEQSRKEEAEVNPDAGMTEEKADQEKKDLKTETPEAVPDAPKNEAKDDDGIPQDPQPEVEQPDAVNAVEERLKAAQEETKSLQDRLLRVSAEFENYKKRSARETDSFRKYANESLLKALLPVMDNLELAIQSSGEEKSGSSCILEGVELTRKELLKVLEKFGVKSIDSVGKPFDPNFHEAAMQEPSDQYPENTVAREFQKGYLLHDRLLRPSMVVVSSGKA